MLLYPSSSRKEIKKEVVYATAYKALMSDDLTHAAGMFGILATLAPQDERAWVGLAAVRERKQSWDAAAALYRIGRSLNPRALWCFVGEARVLARLGKLARAHRLLDKARASTHDDAGLRLIEAVRSEL